MPWQAAMIVTPSPVISRPFFRRAVIFDGFAGAVMTTARLTGFRRGR
jgi:hypothetical protein